jgi:hypothetical protein
MIRAAPSASNFGKPHILNGSRLFNLLINLSVASSSAHGINAEGDDMFDRERSSGQGDESARIRAIKARFWAVFSDVRTNPQ